MKKIIAILSCLVIVSALFLVSVSADSHSLVLDIPAINEGPDFLIFDDLDFGNSNYINLSNNSLFTVYRGANSERTYEVPINVLVIGLDSSYNIVLPTSYRVQYYHNGIYSSQESFTDLFFPIEYTYGYTCSVDSVTPSTVKYLTLIPMPYFEDEDLTSDYFDFYYHSIDNYFYGLTAYQSGYSSGADADYWDGFRDGQTTSNQTAYESGYNDGYDIGLNENNSQAYDEGRQYGESLATSDASTYIKCVFDTVSAPFRAISEFLNFNVLGINLLSVFSFLVTAVIIAFIIKKFV